MAVKQNSTDERLEQMMRVRSEAPGISVEYDAPINQKAIDENTTIANAVNMPADASPADQLDAMSTIKVDEDKPENITSDEPILVAAAGPIKMFGKAVKEMGKKGALNQQEAIPSVADPKPGVTGDSLKATEDALQKFEQTLEQTPATGAPPVMPINVDRIEGPDDFKQTVNALAESTGMRDLSMTWEQTLADANAKGIDPRVFSDLSKYREQYGDLPADLVNLRLAAYANNRLTYDAMRRAYLNPDDMNAQAEVLYQINKQKAINDAYGLVRTRAAQATAAGRMEITQGMAQQMMDEFGDVTLPAANSAEIRQILSDPTASENLKYMIEKYIELDDPLAQEDMLLQVGKGGLVRDLIDRSWKNGLLSATGTHIINLTSNTTFLASTVATRGMAGVISMVKRGVGGQGEVELGEAAAMVAGMVHANREALSLAWKALRTGTNLEMRRGMDLGSDAGMRYEGQYRLFNARDYGVESEMMVKGINGYANFVTLLGGRPIMGMDEYFKTIGYRAELYAQAYRMQMKARREALAAKKSPEEAEALGLQAMEDTLVNPSPEITALAQDFSHMITFSKKLTGSSAQVQELAKTTLLGRITLPFVKAPIWLASETMQHSYLAPLSKQWRADIAAGGAKRELAIAKFGMGSALMTGVGSLVADGRITGGGPGNTSLRQQYMASGWRPYSFVFREGEWDEEFIADLRERGLDPSIAGDGRLYVPYRGFDPLSGPLAIIADTVEYARYEDDQDKVTQVILGGTWGLYNYISEQPVMTGLAGITGAFTTEIPNPKMAFKNAVDTVIKQGATYVTGIVPFQSARGQLARSFDPTKRDVRGDPYLSTGVKGLDDYMNYMYSITPGLSKELPATHDYLGRPEYRGDPANPWISAGSGIRYSEAKQSEADRIINNLEVPLQKPRAAVEVPMPNGSVSVKLTPEEHQQLLRNLGEIVGPMPVKNPETGKYETKFVGLEDAMVALANQPGFMSATKFTKQQEIKDLYAAYVKAAKDRLLQANPQLIERAQGAAIDREVYGISQ
jgi:hypothetical protein